MPHFCLYYFNSNMVRLKGCKKAVAQGRATKFQFQYGSIKRNFWDIDIAGLDLFQFQYGSIKRDSTRRQASVDSLFQFQYGSIKRALRSGVP